MNVEFDRTEILTLMGELPATHWAQGRFFDALAAIVTPTVVQPELAPVLIPQSVTGNTKVEGQCYWDEFGFPCRNDVTTVNDAGEPACKTHEHPVCRNDGKPATHNCRDEYQFVCGALLCADCRSCNKG